MDALVRVLALATTLCVMTAAATADLLVVNNTGSGDFTNPQAAVQAAADGDVILIEHGSFGAYNAFTVDGKALSIVGEEGVSLFGRVTFRNVPAGGIAILADLDVTALTPSFAEPGHALVVEQCQGLVVVQDCLLQGGGDAPASPPLAGGIAVRILQSTEVVLERVHVAGGNSPVGELSSDCLFIDTQGMDGGSGLDLYGSVVYAFDSSFTGGHGEPDPDEAGDGADACYVSPDASLFASRCTFVGGEGGNGDLQRFCDEVGGDGGHGLHADGPATVVEAEAQGGAAGAGFERGKAGLAFVGPITVVQGLGRTLVAPSLVKSPGPLTLSLDGVAGEAVYLLVSTTLDPFMTFAGALLSPAPAIIALGAVPPGSSLALVLSLPQLPVGTEHLVLYAQGIFVKPSPASGARLTGISTLVWL